MQPSEITYCIHSLAETEGEECDDEVYKGLNMVTFCPLSYWKEYECLPDYSFSNEVWSDDLPMPDGYKWYIFVEETQWASKNSKEKIREDMNALGFTENLEMKDFLSGCWQ